MGMSKGVKVVRAGVGRLHALRAGVSPSFVSDYISRIYAGDIMFKRVKDETPWQILVSPSGIELITLCLRCGSDSDALPGLFTQVDNTSIQYCHIQLLLSL